MEPNNPQNQIMTPARRLNQGGVDLEPAKGVKVDLREIGSFIEVVATIPSGLPKTFYDSIKIYISGGTKRLYVYAGGTGWVYTALT